MIIKLIDIIEYMKNNYKMSHLNIKTSKILIFGHWHFKITDWGLELFIKNKV